MADRPARSLATSFGLAFIAGALAVLIFHQGMLGLLHALDVAPARPFDFQPTAPFGIPAVLSAAFWGGVWAIALSIVLRGQSGPSYWVVALVFGALALTAVAWFAVRPLEGQPLLWQPARVAVGLSVNGAWGIGTAILLRLFQSVRSRALRA
jgi:hypothetical protein